MDKWISLLERTEDKDLYITSWVAYQKEIKPFQYDKEYFDHFVNLEGTEIADKLNQGRVSLVKKYINGEPVLDIGIGSGEFIRNYSDNIHGYDVNPLAIRWLNENHLYSDDISSHKAFTFWDVIEHIENPSVYLNRIPDESFVFVSIPIFDDLYKIRESKHYKPDEHLYYFMEEGFVHWMKVYGFECLEISDFETQSGRESIKTFVFKRCV